MKRTVLLRASLCALFVFSAAVAAAQQNTINVAAVSGWRTKAIKVPAFNFDGTPQGESDLRDQLQPGLLRWSPEYDLVKLNRDPDDARWVRARDLNLVFCERPLVQKIVRGGSTGQNQALSMGSGADCP